MAVLEVVNVSAIAPFLALAGNPNMIDSNPLLSWFYSRFDFNSPNEFLVVFGIAVFLVMIVTNAWAAFTTYAQYRYVWSLHHHLAVNLLGHYLKRPYDFFLNRNTADLSKTLLSEVQQVTGQLISPLIIGIGKAVVALGIVLVLVASAPLLAFVVTVVIGGSYALIYAIIRRRLQRIGEGRLVANSMRFGIANEVLGGVKEVKLLNAEEEYLRRFTRPSRDYSIYQATSHVSYALPRYVIEALAFGTVILVIVYLLYSRNDFASIVPLLGLYAFAGLRLMPALQEVFRAVSQIRYNSAALSSILEDLDAPTPPPTPHRLDSSEVDPVSVQEGIFIQDLSYAYPGSDRLALSSITINIPANSTIGIVGRTGSGKTSFVDVLLGLLEPTAGGILVDGQRISSMNIASWQSQLGYVPQHIYLSDASIAKNIAFGVRPAEIDMDAVRAAATIAQIDDFIRNELENGYDTVIGERGIRLSGGQRQRIGIARALYRNPSVIVFDEATSALDNTTEENLMDAMKGILGKRTVIMVAHRLSTLQECDNIYVFESGRIIASGNYESLFIDNKIPRHELTA